MHVRGEEFTGEQKARNSACYEALTVRDGIRRCRPVPNTVIPPRSDTWASPTTTWLRPPSWTSTTWGTISATASASPLSQARGSPWSPDWPACAIVVATSASHRVCPRASLGWPSPCRSGTAECGVEVTTDATTYRLLAGEPLLARKWVGRRVKSQVADMVDADRPTSAEL